MRKRIENKINEIIEAIIEKSPAEITYNEYRILDAKLRDIKWETEQKQKSEEMMQFMTRNIFNSSSSAPTPLPDSKED